MNLKKCIGIISWFTDKEPDRSQRIERIERLMHQLNKLFSDIDILIIAQNWKDYKIPFLTNKLIIKNYNALGILKARKILIKEFLALDYDYLIMSDDDAIVKCDKNVNKEYLKSIDEHPNGFAFIRNTDVNSTEYYNPSQLNFCALSKEMLKKEPMVDIDAQKNEGFEDFVYSALLHNKYPEYEFDFPKGIECIHFLNTDEVAPSTWFDEEHANHVQESIVKSHYYEARFKLGDFTINKSLANAYIEFVKNLETRLDNRWITKEQAEELLSRFFK